MKLMKWLKAHPATLKDVATSTCLLGASAGIVFGVSAGMFKVQYMPLDSAEARLAAATTAGNNYYLENIISGWNMGKQSDSGDDIPEPDCKQATTPDWKSEPGLSWWRELHPNARKGKEPWTKAQNAETGLQEGETIKDDAIKARHDLVSMVIDGATHSTMDRSFNQSLYEGLVDYIKNKKVDHYDPENLQDPVSKNTAFSFKPSQDTTTEIVNIYISTIHNKTIIGVAGFNHATPINTLMTHKNNSALIEGPDPATTTELDESCFILVDSVIPHNQDVASVQFRADQPGFLTGVATCQYFYNNLGMYHDKYQDLEVAAFGGVQIPTVIDYIGGFQRGIELFNYSVLRNILNKGSEYYFGERQDETWKFLQERFENLVNHSKYKQDIERLSTSKEFKDEYFQKLYDEYSVKMIKLGEIGTHFSGTFAAGDAIGITKQYLNRGAGAIIAVAGPQSLDAGQEIRNQNSKCIVIGVDTAMENSDYQRFHEGCSEKNKEKPNLSDKYVDQTVDAQGNHSAEANGIIKFSAIKDIKEVTNRITRLYLNGQGWDISGEPNENGNEQPDPQYSVCGPGYRTCGNIKNGLISISWDGFLPLMQALQCIEFVSAKEEKPVGTVPFSVVWEASVNSYKTLKGKTVWDKIDDDYKNGITDIEKIKTFDKNSTWYKNYHHTIGILAELFSSAFYGKDDHYQLSFDRTMTIKNIGINQWRMLDEGETTLMDIGEWLRNNMYMIS